jgi:hypothetical protein
MASMRRKYDMVQRRRPEEKHRRGGEREEMTPIEFMRILLGQKIKKIHVIDSAATNGW